MQQSNEKNGSLFLNTFKQNPNQPDFTGNCTIEGKPYKIAAWLKTAQKQDGTTIQYYSLAFQEAQPVQQATMPAFPSFHGQQSAQAAPVQSAQVFPPAQPQARPMAQPAYQPSIAPINDTTDLPF